MKACWVLLGIGLAAAGFGQQIIGANTDADVINAAMLSFYGKHEWNDWNEGRFIVVDAQYGSRNRGIFHRELRQIIGPDGLRSRKNRIIFRRALRAIRRPNYKADPARPLKSLPLDDRIVLVDGNYRGLLLDQVDTTKSGHVMLSLVHKVEDRHGEWGTVRASGQLSAPCYSTDGRYALLNMSGLIQSGDPRAHLDFLLENGSSGWAVIFVSPSFSVRIVRVRMPPSG